MSPDTRPNSVVARRPLALVVDRDPDVRELYAEYLKLAAWDTDQAEDGREALAKALTRRPDVIVTDSRLPGISGIELCRLLRRDVATRSVALVVITSDAYGVETKRAESAGASSVLVKPCLPDKLVAELQRLIRTAAGDGRGVDRHAVVGADAAATGSAATAKRATLSRSHARGDTTTPPMTPPALLCPGCDQPLRYDRSHVGGVSARHAEQWDYYDCPAGCGTFQYRQRTRKLRKV